MRNEPAAQEPPSVDIENGEYEPVQLYRTFGWAFLPPAMAALVYGALSALGWFAPSTAVFFSVLFVGALLFSPEKTCLDWYGLCFSTIAVGLIAIGHPLTHLLGGLAALFALLTVFDAYLGLQGRDRALLTGSYVLAAGLSAIVYAIASWATLGLAALYLFLHLSVRLLPIGLAAKASLLEDDES